MFLQNSFINYIPFNQTFELHSYGNPRFSFNALSNGFNSFCYNVPNFSFSLPVFNVGTLTFLPNSSVKSKDITKGFSYANLTKSQALLRAQKDSNLEKLTGGVGWSISQNSFMNDIPYAKKGMGIFLTKLSSEIGENIVVTSALGTSTSPHKKNGGHFDSNNPKLDFGGGLSVSAAESLKSKLDNTGYFTRVEIESHGDGTAHLDVRVKESALKSVDTTA